MFFKRKLETLHTNWPQAVRQDYFSVQIILALEEVGFWDELQGGKKKLEDISKNLSIDADRLRVCVEFLWATTDLLKKNVDDTYELSEKNFRTAFLIVSAYKPVFDNMAALLTGKKTYGFDVIRNGKYLQAASDTVTARAIEMVIKSLPKKENLQWIDLGCGSAQSILDFCGEDQSRVAIGVDVDPLTVAEARKHIEDAGLLGRASVIEGDITKIATWRDSVDSDKEKIFLISTVLHEFLKDGTQWLIDYLKEIQRTFPNSRFFILEFDTPSFTVLKDEKNLEKKLFFAMYRLWHPFSGQGMPQPIVVWEEIFRAAKWRIKKTTRVGRDLIIYDCIT